MHAITKTLLVDLQQQKACKALLELPWKVQLPCLGILTAYGFQPSPTSPHPAHFAPLTI